MRLVCCRLKQLQSFTDGKREKRNEGAKKSPRNEETNSRNNSLRACAHRLHLADTGLAARAGENKLRGCARSRSMRLTALHAFGLAFFAVGVHLSAIKVNGTVVIYRKTMSSCLGRLFDVIVYFIICMRWWWCCCVKTKLASMHVPLFDAYGTHGIDFVK